MGGRQLDRYKEKTDWLCTECNTGKLTDCPARESFRFCWDRQNLPNSKQAIAARILDQFPLVKEVALAEVCTLYIFYDSAWYISVADNETLEKRWGISPREPNNNKPIPGYIYLLRCNDLFKIGRTTQEPRERVAQIDKMIPYDTALVHTAFVDDCVATETVLHNRFSAKRSKGEWFALDEKDVQWMIATYTE